MTDEITVSINPPPANGKCDCCGRHISKLKPFGKEGDPLVGNFDEAMLVKTFRPMALDDKSPWEITDDMLQEPNEQGYRELIEEKFIEKYGKKDLESYWFREQLIDTVGASWECRDCIILSNEDYFKRRWNHD